MYFLMMMLMIFFIISLILMMFSTIISKKMIYNREKSSAFECGFDPKSMARLPFSLHFFLITVIFLIFDIEIALIFPMIPSFNLVNFKSWMKISFFFMIMLLMGLYHEWNQNMLNWIN
uniref:NADH-ubiquinone oxidoreductase chain 3 n=1 Tax=Leucoptera malifoliella TaxID=753488 RepID=J7EZ20_9NEOP|nr:NADH dehydrogenase subunit 3 [Leucoptera malifoliella]AER38733.1 NADH dehydrogenase subunit 3 [Leucoptera malifoliella]WMX20531.1 NADH dehydrogenase subunit 3 [Leucoptera malifoliella]